MPDMGAVAVAVAVSTTWAIVFTAAAGGLLLGGWWPTPGWVVADRQIHAVPHNVTEQGIAR